MTGGRLPAGVRVSSLTGISLRSLRARPLRSLLTAGAIMLGVGMVFGVLLLVGTIHSTFDRLYDSIYGKTDIVVVSDVAGDVSFRAVVRSAPAVPGTSVRGCGARHRRLSRSGAVACAAMARDQVPCGGRQVLRLA